MKNNVENNIIKREKFEAGRDSAVSMVNDDDDDDDNNEQQEDRPVSTRTRRLSSNAALDGQQDAKRTIAKITIRQRNVIDGAIKANLELQQQQQQLVDPNHLAAPTLDELTKVYLRDPSERSELDCQLLDEYSFLIPEVKARIKSRLDKEILKQRVMEFEEPLEIINEKTNKLVTLMRNSRHIVIYTGAGISTSAHIPDYRGPNGLWTQIRRAGTFSITKLLDLSKSEPTFTHMAIRELCKKRLVKHVVSQNCDGLHLRSGISQQQLSEIHGNMYIEVCPTCERQYFRQADVTERTSRFRHKTGRKCHECDEPNNNLIDTIVLYGERSRTKWPMNWERAAKAAKRADLIICMGSSLKTLRRYGCLWPKSIGNSSSRKEPETKLVIINLQYTPKDKMAVLKINGKCDLVMQLVMQRLNIDVPAYDWTQHDPLLRVAIPFTAEERSNLNRNLIFETIGPKRRATPEDDDDKDDDQLEEAAAHKRPKSEPRCSPSLFVSELTGDPDKKGLRMRIRAVNMGATGSNESSFNDTDHVGTMTNDNGPGDEQDDDNDGGDSTASTGKSRFDDNDSIDDCTEQEFNENARLQANNQHHDNNQQKQRQLQAKIKQSTMNKVEYVIPGWLGKSIGATKASSYRRKRHGNKGRKHSSGHQLKASQSISQPQPPPPSLSSPQMDKREEHPPANTDTAGVAAEVL